MAHTQRESEPPHPARLDVVLQNEPVVVRVRRVERLDDRRDEARARHAAANAHCAVRPRERARQRQRLAVGACEDQRRKAMSEASASSDEWACARVLVCAR
eukprot:3973082-Pleurochrysis_carterae.AAC.1